MPATCALVSETLSAALADDIEASVKRIHLMIADLEKEGYDSREIGA